MQSTSRETLDWIKHKLESRLPGETSITSDMQMTHLMGRADSLQKTLMLEGLRRREEKGMTEEEMVGWLHRLSGHEFE